MPCRMSCSAIDRQNGNRIYYINTKRYKFHKDLLTAHILRWNVARCFLITII